MKYEFEDKKLNIPEKEKLKGEMRKELKNNDHVLGDIEKMDVDSLENALKNKKRSMAHAKIEKAEKRHTELLNGFSKVADGLRELYKKNIVFPEIQKVAGDVTARVSNLPAIQKVTGNVISKISNWPDVFKVEGKVQTEVTNWPRQKDVTFPDVQKVEVQNQPDTVTIQNLPVGEGVEPGTNAKPDRYVPVRLTDGKSFYNAVQSAISSIGSMLPFRDIQGKPAQGNLDASGNLKVNLAEGSVNVNGADGAIQDGVSSSIKATVRDYTNSNPLTIELVDESGDPYNASNKLPVDATANVSIDEPLNVDGQVSISGTTTVQATDLDIRDLDSATDSVASVQSGTWNINNVSGSVSLPTGAATASNQSTIIGHVDGIETVLGTVDTSLDNIEAGYAVEGAALGSGVLIQGDDGTDRTNVLVDTSGHLQVDVLTAPTTTVQGTVTANLGATDNAVLDDIAANQTDASQKTQIVDGAGNVIGSTSNALDVNIASGSSAGTEYTEGDTDATITGPAMMWEDSGDTLRPVSTSKPLPTSIYNTPGVQGAAAENAAVSGNPVLSGGRYDATPRTLNDGDVGAVALDADGAVQVSDGGNSLTVDGTVTANLSATDNAVLDSIDTAVNGTLTVDASGAAVPVTDNGSSLTVDGTVSVDSVTTSVTPGTGASHLGKAEDAAHSSGDVGVMALSVRTNTAASRAGTDGDYQPLITDTNGRLHVINSSNETTTKEVVGDAAIDAAITGNPVLIAGRASTATPTAMSADNDVQALWLTRNGALNIADGGGSITVDGTVTADLGATDNAVLDAIQTASEAIQTAVEGTLTVTGGGGGVEYTEGDTDATITGSAIMWEDSADTLRAVSASKPLPVDLGANNDVTVTGTVDLGATDNAVLDSIDTNTGSSATLLGTIDTDTGNIATNTSTIAGAVSGTEMQVDIVSSAAIPVTDNGGALTVDGTVTANLSATDNAVLDNIDTQTAAIQTAVETIDNAISGSEMQVDVVGALPAGTNTIGKVAPNEYELAGNTTHVKKYYTNAGAVTDGIVWSPAAGKRWYITDIIINVSDAATVTLEDDVTAGDDPVFKAELAANSGISHSFTTPLYSGEDAADLLVTTSAGNVYITVTGYEI